MDYNIYQNLNQQQETRLVNYKNLHNFLLDYSNFTGIFNKYDREDLIEKLDKNVAIVEYL